MERQNLKDKGKAEDEIHQESPEHLSEPQSLADLSVTASAVIVSSTFLSSLDKDIPAVVLDLNAPIADALGPVEHSQTVPKDIVAVIDVSGSMAGSIGDVRATLRTLLDVVGPHDRLALVTFNHESQIHLWLTSMANPEAKRKALAVIDCLCTSGTTNIQAAMDATTNIIRKEANESAGPPRMTVTLLLSDGCPNAGIVNVTQLTQHVKNQFLSLGNLPNPPLIVSHSLGFTTGHDSTLLRALTTTGSAGVGLYYFLKNTTDIPAAIGDALGAISSVLYHHVRVQAIPLDSDGQLLTGWTAVLYEGVQPKEVHLAPTVNHVGYLASSDQRNLVFVCLPSASNKIAAHEQPNFVQITLWYKETATGAEKMRQLKVKVHAPTLVPASAIQGNMVVLSDDMGEIDQNAQVQVAAMNDYESLHIHTHLIRQRASEILSSMANARSHAAEVEALHAQLVQLLSRIQTVEVNDKHQQANLTRDESILLALERDLGNALEQLHQGGRLSAQDQMRLNQFSHEHAQQRSASSATELRPTYSTPEQEAMRNKFGASTSSDTVEQKIEAEATAAKATLMTNEAGLTPESTVKRELADQEIQCFITLENWRAANIGIGLFVHPRTMRERYKQLVPQIDLANDYISTDAYNQGARADFKHVGVHAAGGSVMPSSTRGKINAWLPLVINKTNWQFVRRYAPAAFSIIVRGSNDLFRPLHALQVCSRLMCTAVVQFCDNKLHLSERAVQLYCDVHRLLLEMILEYPEIQQVASQKLADFVQKEWVRGRDITPDIGVLIQYLTVSSGVTWADFREAYIQESFRRSARWIESRIGRRLTVEESDEDLVNAWFEGSKVSTSLMLFNVSFLDLFSGASLDDIRATYDENWGRVPDSLVAKMKNAHKEIEAITSIQEALARVGAKAQTVTEIAELIRWAIQNEKEIPVPREIKTLSTVSDGNEAYRKLVVRRQFNASAPTKTNEAQTYANQLATALEAFVALGQSMLLDMGQLGVLVDGPIAWIRQNCTTPKPISLVHRHADHTVMGRSVALNVPEHVVLKEMLFYAGDEPVLVLKNGNERVDTAALQTALNVTKVKMCPSERIALHSSFTRTALCAFGHRVSTPLKIVISREVQDLGNETFVFTSAGCEKFFFSIKVEDLLALLSGATVVRV